MQEVLFTDIQDRLISEIKKAQQSLHIAVAWFNNKNLFDCLIDRTMAGVDVKLIIINDEVNNRPDGLDFQKLIDSGVEFYFAKTDQLMHHKFCIIDDAIVFNGSYNWTYAAERKNKENVTILSGNREVIQRFRSEFNGMISGVENVRDVLRYLLSNPPIQDVQSTGKVLLDEASAEVDVLLDHLALEEQISLLKKGLSSQPDNAEWQDKLQRRFSTFSHNLGEFCRRYPNVLLTQITENYPFSKRILDLYKDKLNWGSLQSNEHTLWTYDLRKHFDDRLMMTYGTGLPIPWFVYNKEIQITRRELNDANIHLDRRFEDLKSNFPGFDEQQLGLDELFFMNKIPENYPNPVSPTPGFANVEKTPEYLEEFKDTLNWHSIALDNQIEWSRELFDKYESYLLPHMKAFSKNTAFPWTQEFIEKYSDHLSFEFLSRNEHLPWTDQLILKFENKWFYNGRDNFCSNEGVCWTDELLEKLKDKGLDWDTLANNPSVPWNLLLMEKYAPENGSDDYFHGLSRNRTVWKNVFEGVLDDRFLTNIASRIHHSVSISHF